MHFLFCFGATPGGSQGLILAQHSGITHDGLRGTRDQIQVSCLQDKHPAYCTISLAPNTSIFFFLKASFTHYIVNKRI